MSRDSIDYLLTLEEDLESMIGQGLRLLIFTDSKSLFDVITKNSILTVRRLIIDGQEMREALEEKMNALNGVAWIKSEINYGVLCGH